MDKTTIAAQTDKLSPEKAAAVRSSRKMAARLKTKWEDLQKRQNGRRVRSDDRISSVSVIRNRQGKESVRVNMGSGREIFNASVEQAAAEFEKTARKVYPGSRIEEFLRKIKENGWDAVEGEIPAEIKDAVRSACERANISLSSKGERAKEQEAARQASQRAAKTADHAIKAAIRPAAPKNAFDNKKMADLIAATALADFAASAFCKKNGIEMIRPTEQRRSGSFSKKETIALKKPDGTSFEINLVGADINANRVKAQALVNALFRQEQGLPPEEGEKELLEAAEKQGIKTLKDLSQRSGRINNISNKNIPEKYQADLKAEGQKDKKNHQAQQEANGKKKGTRAKETVRLDAYVGRKISEMVNECRENKKDKTYSAEDKNKYTLLNFYSKMNKEDVITPAAEKFVKQMTAKGISGAELFAKYNNGKTAQDEMERYISDRISGKLPAPQKDKKKQKQKRKQKQNTPAIPVKETAGNEKRRVLEQIKADYAAQKRPSVRGLQQKIAGIQATATAAAPARSAVKRPIALQAALIKQHIDTPTR